MYLLIKSETNNATKNRIIINLDGVQNVFNFSEITNGTNIIIKIRFILEKRRGNVV